MKTRPWASGASASLKKPPEGLSTRGSPQRGASALEHSAKLGHGGHQLIVNGHGLCLEFGPVTTLSGSML
ncbi:MAG: hypothetical protein RJB60_1897, partial [Pseudomonadota bacterium]